MAKKTASTRRRTAKTSRTGTRPRRRAGAAVSSAPNVRVRMYRQGLGDCFLITFDVGGDEKHMLIDCGSLGSTTTGVKLVDVVKDIRTVTNDHLHLVIATHEHWDHVSGFGGQQDEFKKITVDHVWMAWTENPDDDEAKNIAKFKNDLGTALAAVAKAMISAPGASPSAVGAGEAVASILGFFDDTTVLAAGKFAETVNDAMTFVRTGFGVTAQYCIPGMPPKEEAWLPGFRFFVLGPPKDEAALNDLGDHGSSELYGLSVALKASADFIASGKSETEHLATCGLDDRTAFVSAMPFDARFRVERGAASATAGTGHSYFAPGDEWRRIDEDWLHVASDLALQLDSATNNTSLALAIERIADGKVLLFPADAQQGNWLSWQDKTMKWTVDEPEGAREVTVNDLLARTVFYKVGHHSSHNATAKAKGLELMARDGELTAFIPVDRAVALSRNPKDSWQMPARPLYRRLLEKCQGRVARSDVGWAADAAAAANKAVEQDFVGMAKPGEWNAWGAAQTAATHVQMTPLYIDFVLD
jgi:hypothetical protein